MPDPGESSGLLRPWAARLAAGEVIAFPTETLYGLLARIDRPAALQRVFELKGRPAGSPMPVIAADVESALRLWVLVPDAAHRLIAAFWPGPLTLVLPATEEVSTVITAGTGAVGVRVPGSAAARGIAAMAGAPLAATSANPSGRAPAMSPAEVRAYFGEQAPVPDGPQLAPSNGSTVLDLCSWPPVLLRAGDIDRERIEAVLGIALIAL